MSKDRPDPTTTLCAGYVAGRNITVDSRGRISAWGNSYVKAPDGFTDVFTFEQPIGQFQPTTSVRP